MINKIRHIFCQKVLPLVYDASLSYYEFLCKLLEKLNETITQVNIIEERLDGVDERLDGVDDRINGIDSRLTICEQDIDGLEMRMDAAEGAISDLLDRVGDLEGASDDLLTRLTAAEIDIDTLQGFADVISRKVGNFPDSLGNPGQVLTVNAAGTAAEWKDVPEELPAYGSGDSGKVLKVNSSGSGVEWGSGGGGVPSIGSGDAGKVLTVNSSETGAQWENFVKIVFITEGDTDWQKIAALIQDAIDDKILLVLKYSSTYLYYVDFMQVTNTHAVATFTHTVQDNTATDFIGFKVDIYPGVPSISWTRIPKVAP